MGYLTLGVIGHVDHGKTSLVRALTGVDTDRLKEEKERGISIALGYTYLDVQGGKLGVVDVPGHERFIRTMVSGATGIRAVLLVLDVNEGVKPQTVEHIRIAEMLGIEHGVVAITKCDTADEDMRELAGMDIQEFLEGSFLENAPLVYTSAESGEGLEELKGILGEILARVEALPDSKLPYLPVDRVFSMSGFGTVVTGTLRRGTISVEDDLVVYPRGEKVRIRELQSHGEHVESVQPGMRTAVNVRGVSKLELKRGDALAPEGTLLSGSFTLCALTLLPEMNVSVKQRQQVRVLWGTSEVVARVHVLGGDTVVSGETAMVQLQFESPVCSMFGERAVIRSYSPVDTIGGAVLLEFGEARLKRDDAEAVRHAEILYTGTAVEILGEALKAARNGVVSKSGAGVHYGLSKKKLKEAWQALNPITVGEDLVADSERVLEVGKDVLEFLGGYHERNPTIWGPSEEQVYEQMRSGMAEALVSHALKGLVKAEKVATTQGLVHLADFRAGGALTDEEQGILAEIEAAFRDGGLHPPGVVEVLHNDKERMRLYRCLVDNEILYATAVANKPKTIANMVVFHADVLHGAVEDLQKGVAAGESFSPSDAKAYIETSRKYLIPLLECMDRMGVTKRVGDGRVLVG